MLSLLQLKLQSEAYVIGKSVVLHILKRPEIRTHYWEDREEKKRSPGGILTHNLYVKRHVLYRCATTSALNDLNLFAEAE